VQDYTLLTVIILNGGCYRLFANGFISFTNCLLCNRLLANSFPDFSNRLLCNRLLANDFINLTNLFAL